jgi:hypothetical protein
MYDDPYGGGGGFREDDLAALLVGGCFLLAMIGFLVFVYWQLHRAFDAVPEPYRQMPGWQVWLLLIPCFGIVWNFFVFQKLPRSMQAYLESRGDGFSVGSLEQLGLWYAILSVASIVPYIGGCFGLAALVVLIIFLVKVVELRKKIEAYNATGFSKFDEPWPPG